jgi:23S rRNA pseudouridine2605 synthase
MATGSQEKNDPQVPEGAVRLNKVLAGAGVCSRRGADELILQGAVRVNGETISTPGVKVVPGKDRIEVRGVPIQTVEPETRTHEYIVLFKPVGVVTTASDPRGRRTVLDLLPKEVRALRPFPAGRLDYNSEGLLLLTTDGEVVYRLTHPKWHLEKVYHVVVRGVVPQEALDAMQRGMRLSEGETLAPVGVSVFKVKDERTTLEMVLIQGVNRQIRRMCRDLGLEVFWLRRVRQGPLELGDLEPGGWRNLSQSEAVDLRKAVGLG